MGAVDRITNVELLLNVIDWIGPTGVKNNRYEVFITVVLDSSIGPIYPVTFNSTLVILSTAPMTC